MSRKCLQCDNLTSTTKETYCSLSCFRAYNANISITEWLSGKWNGSTKSGAISVTIKNYLIKQANGACPQCGWDKKNPQTGRTPLEVNHIDGNWENNVPTNLEVLCPNCHAITSNYKALNMGKGRAWRKKYNQYEPISSQATPPSKRIYYCACGETVPRRVKQCKTCRSKNVSSKESRAKRIRPPYPPYKEVLLMLESMSYAEVGRQVGVTGSAVKKFLVRNLPEGEDPLPSQREPLSSCACGKKLRKRGSKQCQSCANRDKREKADAQFPAYENVANMLSSSSQQSVSETIGVPVYVLRRFLKRHEACCGSGLPCV